MITFTIVASWAFAFALLGLFLFTLRIIANPKPSNSTTQMEVLRDWRVKSYEPQIDLRREFESMDPESRQRLLTAYERHVETEDYSGDEYEMPIAD